MTRLSPLMPNAVLIPGTPKSQNAGCSDQRSSRFNSAHDRAWACDADTLASGQKLPRRALCQDALQGTAVHVQPTCRFRDVAVAHLIDALDVLPAHAICRHWIVRQFGLLGTACQQCRDNVVGVGGL